MHRLVPARSTGRGRRSPAPADPSPSARRWRWHRAGDEAPRRLLLAGDRQKGARELGGVAGLLAMHAFVALHPLRMTVGVVRNGRLSVGRRLLRQEIGAVLVAVL